MLALSPFLPTFGFPLDDQNCYNQNWASSTDPFLDFNHKEWNSLDSFGGSPLENDQLHNSRNSGATSSDPLSSKKLDHNASERERRQKLNGLYSTLRSLLPKADHKKKSSIPTTISQAVKYIPQLQDQVERLIQRKEEILASITVQSDDLACDPKHNKGAKGQSSPTVSTCQIKEREVVIQVCASKINNKNPFSAVLENLERDELQILNVSAFASGENKVLYTIHVQTKGTQSVECDMMSQKFTSFW